MASNQLQRIVSANHEARALFICCCQPDGLLRSGEGEEEEQQQGDGRDDQVVDADG